jgi:hypothetical protein
MGIFAEPMQAQTGSLRFKGGDIGSTSFKSTGQNYYFYVSTNQLILYKYQLLMLQFNSNNQIVSSYFNDNKKQSTIVNSSCHFKPNVNHLLPTSTYTSYFLLLFFVTKYYKLVAQAGGDSVKSDQTYIPIPMKI